MSRVHRHARRETVDSLRRAIGDALSDASRQVPKTLVLTAGPGAGKSYTLANLRAEIGATTRTTCADDLSWRQPFAVAATLIGAELPVPVPDGYEDHLYDLVDALCAAGPVALFVDDAHHADAASLGLLARLSAASRDLPLVLVIGRRPLPERDLLTRLLARPTVHEWHLPPMTDTAIADLCQNVLGARPDRGLAAALSSAGGNPMHAISLLRTLQQSGALDITDGRARLLGDTTADLTSGSRDTVAEHLALLDPRARDLTQKLAVWGGPATLLNLAAIDDTSPAGLVGPAQSAADAGIIRVDDDGTVAFTHDLYAEVTYDHLAPAFRTVLHDAIAALPQTSSDLQTQAHHRMASGSDPAATLDAVRRAESALTTTPAVAVDLLDSLARQSDADTTVTPGVHLSLAVALARTGQLARACEVATEGLPMSADIDEIAALHRVLMFALIGRGDTAQALDLIDTTLALPIEADTTDMLTDLRSYVVLLQGDSAVPTLPFFDVSAEPDRSIQGLVGESLRLFLSGRLDEALTLALRASDRQGQEITNGALATSSADIWPPLIELYARGPAAAAELFTGMTRLRDGRGTDWMTAYHEFTRGGIEYGLGHLDDAAAAWDSGLELAASADMGWTSMAHGSRVIVDILRGELATAGTRLDTWTSAGLPDQFGLPLADRGRALLLEARRRLRPAAQSAADTWHRAVELRVHSWLPTFAIDCARIGTRAQDLDLIASVRDGLDSLEHPPLHYPAALVAVATARCRASLGDTDLHTVVEVGRDAATALQDISDRLSAACAWEESACAAAALGDKPLARELARNAIVLSQSMGAVSVSTRIASRLRPHGVRLDPRTIRDRPTHGWDSLTPTETAVAELVASGLSGADIATQMFISPRTVQTHVSHALAKLGLSTRIELAAFIAARNAGRA
ncbi:LuxR C-terminal-related transcriptional regulator [Gordonia sp. NPDC003950]|jgi:DNA-binding CsgD family transcriptional regulator